jgi:NitT/TauT family transport system substrate-binding protein
MKGITLSRRGLLAGAGAATTAFGLPMRAGAATATNLGVLRLTSHAPNYIAFERGYFTDEGLDVNLVFFEAAQPMAVAIASGDADFGVTAISGGLISLAEKGAVKVIGGALAEEPGVPGAVLLASNAAWDAGLTTAAALPGRSYGITTAGSSFHYMLSRIAKGEGFDIATVEMRPLQKVGTIVAALGSGQIDSWCIQPSIANRLLAEDKAKKLADLSSYDPNYQVTTVFTSSAIAADDRAKAEAFLRALSRGVADYNAAFVDKTADAGEQAALSRIVGSYVSPDVAEDAFLSTMMNGSQRINQGLALSLQSVRDQLEWFKAEGMVPATVTEEMLIDPSFVPAI